MANDIYGDTLDQVDAEQSTTPKNKYDAVLDQEDAASAIPLRQSFQKAATVEPDRAAKVQQLSRSTGLPADVVDRNYDDLSKRQFADRPYDAIQTQTPTLATWAADPKNAAVASDDLEPLGALEWLLKAPQRAVAQTLNAQGYGALRTASLYRDLSQSETDLMNSYKVHMADGGELGTAGHWFRGAVTGGIKLGTMLASTMPVYGLGGAAAGGLIGSLAGPEGTAAGLKLGFDAGNLYGLGKMAFQTEAASAYDQYLGIKDNLGQPIDPKVARMAALATGSINAALMTGGGAVLAKTIGAPIEKLGSAFVRDAVTKALQVPTVRAALLDAAKTYGVSLTEGTALMVGMKAVNILGGELAKQADSAQTGKQFDITAPSDVFNQLLKAGAEGAQSFAIAAGIGPSIGFAHDVVRAERAKNAPAFFGALGEGVAQSKTAQRLPDAAREFIEQATKDGPISTVYAPVESWTQYWQGQGVDPAEMAERVIGSRDAYEHAQRSGEDLPIPTARYATTLAATEHNAFFANELRLGPDEMNGREAAAFAEQVKAAQAPEPTPPSGVQQAVMEKLTTAGVPAETAGEYAKLYESTITNLAERAGLDPKELFDRYGLNIERDGMPGEEAAATPERAAAPADGELVDEAGRPLGGSTTPYEGTERRVDDGHAYGGPERRNQQLTGSIAERAAAMRRENPNIDAQAAAMRAKAANRKHPEVVDKNAHAAQNPEQYFNVERRGTAQEGDRSGDAAGQQPGADEGRPLEGTGDANGAEPRRLPSAPLPGPDEIFVRPSREAVAARLTPEVVRELDRIVEELENFPFVKKTFTELERGAAGKGNAGHYDIVAGNAQTDTYKDIQAFAPYNEGKGKRKGQAAKAVESDGQKILDAARTLLHTGDVRNNLAEGALRVAENRAAGDYSNISAPSLPAKWGREIPDGFEDALSAAIDQGLSTSVDMLNPDAIELALRNEDSILEPDGPVDTSFNVDEFNQSLFDDLEPPDPTVDTLTTGEQQPRLPGAEDVRNQDKPTPEVADAPFALTSEVAKPRAGKNRTLFQTVYHGTPHRFEAFSLHAIGTGEGNQAYGWGLYFASRKEIAETYREALSEPPAGPEFATLTPEQNKALPQWIREHLENVITQPIEIDGITKDAPAILDTFISQWKERIEETRQEMRDPYAHQRHMARERLQHQSSGLAAMEALKASGDFTIAPREKPGRTYTVEIPDEDYLDWDKPASRQTPKVQDALKALGVTWEPVKIPTFKQALRRFDSPRIEQLWREDIGIRESLREGMHYVEQGNQAAWENWYGKHQGYFAKGMIDPTGESIYSQLQSKSIFELRDEARAAGSNDYGGELGRAARRASESLNKFGVNGIRYLDGSSRTAGEGMHNFVVFDDKLAKITEFNQAAPKELTPNDVAAWTDELKARIGPDLQTLNVTLDAAGDLNLNMLAVDRGAQRAGLGSNVMRELTRFADLNGKRLTLSPATKGDAFGTTSRARLVKFYKRFGFVENKGRNADLSISAGMYREPTVPAAGQTPEAQAPQTDSPEFKNWFGESKVVDAAGKPLVVYHGAARGDRIGDTFRPERATSGPMAFFTTDKAIAEKYATDKQDTSFEPPDDYRGWFKMKPKGRTGEVDLRQAWSYLTPEERRTVIERLPTVGYQEPDTADGPIVADSSSIAGKDHIDYLLKEARGNGLEAAKELWLNSGSLFDQEEKFLDVLKGLGLEGKFRLDDPNTTEHQTVFDAYLTIKNPLVTNAMPADVIAALEARAEIEPRPEQEIGGDIWDKRLRDPEDWIANLKKDTAEGNNSFVWSSIPDWVTEELKKLGYDGIHDTGGKMGGQAHDVWIPFESTQIKSASKNSGAFDPTNASFLKQERRGAIRFGADRQMTIKLFERADLSTFLHESGHFFLEVFGDIADKLAGVDPSTLTDQQRSMLSDYGRLFEHFGIDNRDQLGEQQHEQFARSFEAYLMEGKAPSLELQGTFARFRAWLVGVYRSLTNLHVELTPQVRGILDRMVASDRAIQDAEAQRGIVAMFTAPEDAGMSPTEFGLYRKTVEDASRTARETLDRRLFADVQREQTAQWKAQRADVKASVERDIYARPEYQALAAMQRGTHPNGDPLVEGMETAPLKLDATLIADRYGRDRAKRLPRGVVAADGGVDPDLVARMFGFASGDAMLTAVEKAPPMRAAIEQGVKQQMFEKNGNTLLDGTLHEKAQAAVANEDRDLVIRAELRALANLRRTVGPFVDAAKKGEQANAAYERRWNEAEAKLRIAIAEGRKQVEIDKLQAEVSDLKAQARGGAQTIRAAMPPDSVLKAAAEARINALRIGSIQPQAFWSASRRSGQMALDRAARQDFDGAIQAKQQELISVNLYRTAEAALDTVDAGVKFAQSLTSTAARQRIGKAGGGFLDQIDGILDRFEFAKVADKVLDRRASLRDWAEALTAQGMPADQLPDDLLQEANRKNYKEMTLEEFQGVTDGLRQIAHLAALKNRMLKAQDAREFGEVRDGVVSSIFEHNDRRPKKIEFSAADERWRAVSGWFAAHRKISNIAQALDGYEDGGAFWTAFMKPINEAADDEAMRKQEAGEHYAAIIDKHYPGGELRRLQDKLDIPGVGSISKEARLALALNWGNETSRDRVLADPQRGWSREQVSTILDTLDKRDWDFVQDTFNYINTFWSEIAAKQERVTGIAPEKVEAAPIETKFGSYDGGYYPLQYDSRFSPRVAQNELASKAKLETSAAYVRTTTKRGHVEARKANVKLPLRLDLSVVSNHLDQVIHDLTHHETLIDVTRVLRDPKVSKAIIETNGDQLYHALTASIQDIALGSSGGPRNAMDKAATFIKTGSQIAQLGWNLWTGVQAPLGIFNGAARIGPEWVARGAYRWLRDAATMTNTLNWITDVSPMMKERGTSLTQDVSDLRSAFREPGGWFDGIVRKVTNDHLSVEAITDSMLWHLGVMYRVAEVPTWLGQYEKSMAAGESEERAFRIADQAVLDTHGGGNIKDLSQVQRGGPVAKLFMMFYSYGSTVYNATAREAGMVNPKSPASVGRFLGHLGLLYVMPAVVSTAMREAFGKEDTKDFFQSVGRESASIALNTMVLVRELGALAQEGNRGYGGPAGTRLFDMIDQLGAQVKQGKPDEALAKAVLNVGGVLLHLPATQIERTIDGWVALEEGRTKNPAALIFGGPPKKQ